MKTVEQKEAKHAKISGPKHAEMPEIADYERPELEKYEKPEFGKTKKVNRLNDQHANYSKQIYSFTKQKISI